MSSVNVTLKSVFDDRGIKQAQKSFGSVGGQLGKVAKGLAAAFSVAAITNFASSTLKAAEAAQVANNRLDQIASSMGIFGSQASQVTGRLKDFADQQMMVIGQDDELIKSTQAKLLTFKELAATADTAGGAFDRATIAAFDLAAAGFGSAETNAVQLGKALQDPIKGLAALRRSGITFTEAQKEQISTLVESNKMLEAQDIVLSAIEQQVGGTAAATVTGFQRIKLAMGEAAETVGNALLPVFEQLVPIIVELTEKFAPVLAKIMESLGPIFETLVKAVDPLLTALQPLFDVFVMIADVLNDVLKAALPPIIKMVEIFAPIIKQLAEALLPLVQKLLPVFGRLLDALMPFIEILADYLTYVLIPALEFLADLIGDYLVWYLGNLATAFEKLGEILQPLWDKVKPFFEGMSDFQGKAPNMVNVIDGIAEGFVRLREKLGPLRGLLNPVLMLLGLLRKGAETAANAVDNVSGSTTSPASTGEDNRLRNLKPVVIPFEPFEPKDDPAGKTKGTYDKVRKVILKAQADIAKAERDYARTKFEINRDYEDSVAALRKDATKKQEDLLKESQARITDAFRSATQLGLSDLFSSKTTRELETQVKQLTSRLTLSVTKETEKTAYSSVTDIINGLRDRISASKTLLANASELAALGFKQTFIEQVLETGTETGNALSSAILDASPETRRELQTLFTELEDVSETGADSLAKKFGLATRELAKQSAEIATELDLALEAQNALLLRNLADAAYGFQTQIADVKTQFLLDLEEFDGAFAGLGSTIDKLIEKFSRLLKVGQGDIQAMITGPSGDPNNPNPLENATITNNVALKDIKAATGLVIDELSDVKGAAAYLQARITAANTYIKSSTSNAAQEMAAAASIADWTNQLKNLQGLAATGEAAGTVININVRTDTTQSQAMVGKTIGKIVTKYVTTGGQVLVSGS